MQLKEAIWHGIQKSEKTSGINSAKVKHRATELLIDNHLEETAENVLGIYSKVINHGYGTFNNNTLLYQFPLLLKQYLDNTLNFIKFSQDATDLIASKMSSSFFATGGYALFLRYSTNQNTDWLLIVMLKLKAGATVDEITQNLSKAVYFDISHLHEAARIDLNKWKSNTQPYLSFIKKSKGGEDVTKYFREALGCTEYTDSKHNTKEVIRAVDDFCNTQAWTGERRNDVRRKTYEYCETKNKEEEPINLTALSAYIFDQEPMAFAEFVRENNYEVSDIFKPHKDTYNRLHRIHAKVGNIKISFDIEDVIQQRVDYDADHNCLIINNVNQELIDQITKAKT